MSNFLQKIKEKGLWKDLINVILGLFIVVLIILFVLFPGSSLIIGLLFCAAGGMNLWTGFVRMSGARQKTGSKRTRENSMAMCFIMLGAVIFFLGAMVMRRVFF